MIGGANTAAQTAEIFDERTQSFVATSVAPKVDRKDHRAVTDNVGRVWFVGGSDQSGQSQGLIEFFDPSTGTFKVIQDDLSEGRNNLAATFIPELNVIVVVGGERKGQIDGRKDPSSNLIEVIDVDRAVSSAGAVAVGFLKSGERNAPTLQLLAVDAKIKRAELLVLQGVAETHDGQKYTPAPEKITIQLK